MIRFHDAQDFLSAEVTPLSPHGAGGTTAAAIPSYAAVHSGGYGAATNHSFPVYTAALPLLLIAAASFIALLLTWPGRRGAVGPRRVSAADESPGGGSPRHRPLPGSRMKLPVHRANRKI